MEFEKREVREHCRYAAEQCGVRVICTIFDREGNQAGVGALYDDLPHVPRCEQWLVPLTIRSSLKARRLVVVWPATQ